MSQLSEPPEDPKVVELLDDYLYRLQTGETPDREAVLREHPELASALDCLEALEDLAPRGDSESETIASYSSVGQLPQAFGHYELLSEIGRGGMGVVYKARQEGLDRLVAVKMILSSHLASPEHVRRFQTEAKAAARVRHPHIVHIHDVGQIHGQDFFTMEFIEGESLADRVKGGPVDAETAVRIVAAVARAVDHLHEQDIVHRDLKPSNILLDEEDLPYVTDFGLAKIFTPDTEMTATGVIAGTPSYMSPEQAAGHSGEVGAKTDVYSLGAILYELLTGRPPFREESPIDTLMGVLGRDPPLPRQLNPRIPRSLELVCLKCLAKSPDDRFESAGALAEALERFARGEDPGVRPPNAWDRLVSWVRRQPALASRLGALIVFYAVETIHWHCGIMTDRQFHWKVSLLMAGWAAASVFCQRVLVRRHGEISMCYAWGLIDSAALLSVLLIAKGAASPLIVAYPLLIVGSGLWFRVRFVTFMTVLSLLSYGILVVDFYWWSRDKLHNLIPTTVDRHVIFMVALVLLGAVVAYLVHQVRILSSFYGRQLP